MRTLLNKQIKKFIQADRVVHLLILLNILLAGIAFLKDVFLAAYFGTTTIADAVLFAFFIPDMIGNNLLAIAMSVSCVPIFSRLSLKENAYQYHETIGKISMISTLISIVFIIILLMSSKPIFSIVSEGFTNEGLKITYYYFYIMVLIVLFSPIWMIGSSVLQADHHFTIPALTPIIFNLAVLVAIALNILFKLPMVQGGISYSLSIIISTTFVAVFTWFFVWRNGIKLGMVCRSFFSIKGSYKQTLDILRIFTPYLLILFASQVVFLVERYVASTLGTGVISGLTYAYRISQFPIWVFVAAINTVLLPTISRYMAQDNVIDLKREISQSIKHIMMITSIVSCILFFFGEQLIAILLVRGAFDLNSLQITSDILKGYSLSILGQSLYLFSLRYFIAQGKMMIPFLIGLLGSTINIWLIFILVNDLGVKGIGYAAAIGYSVSGALLFFFFYREHFRKVVS